MELRKATEEKEVEGGERASAMGTLLADVARSPADRLPKRQWTREQAIEMARRPRKTRSLWTKVCDALDEGEERRTDGKVSWTKARDALASVLCTPEHPAYSQAIKLASERFDPVAKYVVKQELQQRVVLNLDAQHTSSTSESVAGPIDAAVQQSTISAPPELPPHQQLASTSLASTDASTGSSSESVLGPMRVPVTDSRSLESRVAELESGQKEMLAILRSLAGKLG